MCHMNSEPRAILNRNAPGIIARIWLKEKVLALTEYKFVEPDDVFFESKLTQIISITGLEITI